MTQHYSYTVDRLRELWKSQVPGSLTDDLDETGWQRLFDAVFGVNRVLSRNIARWLDGMFVSTAETGVRAAGVIRIVNTGATNSVLLPGALFRSSTYVLVRTTATATLLAGDYADVACSAVVVGRGGNLPAYTPMHFIEGTFAPGETDIGSDLTGEIQPVYAVEYLGPPVPHEVPPPNWQGYWNGPELVSYPVDAGESGMSGGRDPMLEALGKERGSERQTDESESEYRNRVRYMPDTVAPHAIVRSVRRVLQQALGVPHPLVVLVEHWQVGAVLDIDPLDEETGPDDQKGNPPGHLDWLSSGDRSRWFTVIIEPVTDTPEGLVFDLGPYDVVPYDVGSPAATEVYDRVYETIRAAKPAGVGFYLKLTTDSWSDTYGYADDTYATYPTEV